MCFRLSLKPMVLILTSIIVIELVAAIGLGIYYTLATDPSGTLPFFLQLLFGTNATAGILLIKKPMDFFIFLQPILNYNSVGSPYECEKVCFLPRQRCLEISNNSRLKFRHEFSLGHICLQKLLVSFEKILPKSNGSNQKKKLSILISRCSSSNNNSLFFYLSSHTLLFCV